LQKVGAGQPQSSQPRPTEPCEDRARAGNRRLSDKTQWLAKQDRAVARKAGCGSIPGMLTNPG